MKAKDVVEHLKTQSEIGADVFEKDVVVRVGGRDYAIRRVHTSTSSIILEGEEEIIHEDRHPGYGEAPGGLEGEGVEPEPPGHTLQESEQITPVAEVVPDEVLDETEGGQPEETQTLSPGAEEGQETGRTQRKRGTRRQR